MQYSQRKECRDSRLRLSGWAKPGSAFCRHMNTPSHLATLALAFSMRLLATDCLPIQEAAKHVGALGLVLHELASVVTLTVELAADVPAASVASTENP